MTDFTQDERSTLRTAAFGAMSLVSKADPGFFEMFKESMAGAKALAAAPPELRDLLRDFSLPKLPPSPAEFETAVLNALSTSVSILQQKNEVGVDAFRNVVLAACDAVAKANRDMSQAEQAVIDNVRSALDRVTPQDRPPSA